MKREKLTLQRNRGSILHPICPIQVLLTFPFRRKSILKRDEEDGNGSEKKEKAHVGFSDTGIFFFSFFFLFFF